MMYRTIVLALAATASLGLAVTAAQAGAKVCRNDADCRHGYVCKPDHVRTDTTPRGTCARAPRVKPTPQQTMCPMIYQPVCGADGKTYPNSCHAQRAGARVSHAGACAG